MTLCLERRTSAGVVSPPDLGSPGAPEVSAASAERSGVVFRVLEPADARHLAALFDRLSPRSRYLRFLAPVHRLPPTVLESLAAIDHGRHEALGAFDAGDLVGVAHYFRSATEPTRAEVAVAVADSHQRRGLGTRLVADLAWLGRRRGITHLTATALRENHAVRALLASSAWQPAYRSDGPQLQITITL